MSRKFTAIFAVYAIFVITAGLIMSAAASDNPAGDDNGGEIGVTTDSSPEVTTAEVVATSAQETSGEDITTATGASVSVATSATGTGVTVSERTRTTTTPAGTTAIAATTTTVAQVIVVTDPTRSVETTATDAPTVQNPETPDNAIDAPPVNTEGTAPQTPARQTTRDDVVFRPGNNNTTGGNSIPTILYITGGLLITGLLIAVPLIVRSIRLERIYRY
jgi:hypothetical protein